MVVITLLFVDIISELVVNRTQWIVWIDEETLAVGEEEVGGIKEEEEVVVVVGEDRALTGRIIKIDSQNRGTSLIIVIIIIIIIGQLIERCIIAKVITRALNARKFTIRRHTFYSNPLKFEVPRPIL